jgi:phosphohistidine phosphatase
MLVGHEPDFSLTISALIGGGKVILKKGGLARVDITTIDALQGELVWLLPPKSMRL